MAWEENSRICLNMQLIAILSRIGVITDRQLLLNTGVKTSDLTKVKHFTTQTIFNIRYFVNIAKKK